MAIARVTVLDFADEQSKKHNLHLYEQRWKEVFPNMHMNMIAVVAWLPLQEGASPPSSQSHVRNTSHPRRRA